MNELVKENVVLQMKNIHKNFTGVKALQAVDFSLREGEIHALMGENGAGKSTLIKVLTGVYEKDEGEIFLAGSDKAVEIHSPQDAQNLGNQYCVSGNYTLPEPVRCREHVYRTNEGRGTELEENERGRR